MIYVLVAAALLALAAIGWRAAMALPCPPAFARLVEMDNPLFRNNRAGAILTGLGLRPGMSAIDLGCGPGRLTLPLAAAVGPTGKVLAVDLQPEMLAKVEARCESAGLANVDFRRAQLGAGELPPGPFDRATLVTVLGELQDKAAALAEAFQVLRPGGLLALTEVITDPHFQRREAAMRLAGEAGFLMRKATGGAISYTLYLERP
jgi:ubiquinone/menaquinone biosynthesis C-methylase UbiE